MFGQPYEVLTVDEVLCHKLMELQRVTPEYRAGLFHNLGGLHISVNCQKLIGHQTQSSGLADAWMESGVLGSNTIKTSYESQVMCQGNVGSQTDILSTDT